MEDKENYGILTTDRNLIVTYWNSWLEEKTKIPRENVIGKVLTEIYPDLIDRGITKIFEEVLQNGVVRILSTRFHKYLIPIEPSYPSRYFDKMRQRATIAPLKTEKEVVGLIITIEDVTQILEEEMDLKEKLKSPDEKERISALRKLSQKEDEEIVEAISDESWKVRKIAVEEIKKKSGKFAYELLKRMKEEHQNLSVLNSVIQILSSTTDMDIIYALSQMLKDEDPDLRLYTVQILSNINFKEAEDLLISALSDNNPNVVFSAIEGLGNKKSQKAIPYLLRFLEIKDYYLGVAVLNALKEINDPTIIEKIHPYFEDELFKPHVIEILGELGDKNSVKILVNHLNQSPEYVEEILTALGNIYRRYEKMYEEGEYIAKEIKDNLKPQGLKNILDFIFKIKEETLKNIIPILAYLEDPTVERYLIKFIGNPNVRNETIEVLIKYGKEIEDLLIERLKDEDIEIKTLAIMALGRIGSRKAVPYILDQLEDENLTIVCAGALAKIGDRRAFEPLIKKLGHPNPYIRQSIISALNSIGHPEMKEKVKELLVSDNPYEKESAIKIIGYFGYEEYKNDLIKLLEENNEEIRKAVYENIVFFDDEKIVEILERGLEKEKRKIREVIARSLIYIDKEKALPLIEIALKDSSPWVRYYAVKSLVFHNPPHIFEILENLLINEESELVKAIIIESLGNIGNKKAIPIIQKFLDSNNKDLTLNAISALGNIDHPETTSLLLRFLNSRDKDLKKEAIRALKNKKDPIVIQNILWSTITESDRDIIKEVLLAFLQMGLLESYRALLYLSLYADKREIAIEALSQIPLEEIPNLLKVCDNITNIEKKALILALERKRKGVTKYIAQFLKDDDRDVKIQAIYSLHNLGSMEEYKILKDFLLEERDSEVVQIVKNILEGRGI